MIEKEIKSLGEQRQNAHPKGTPRYYKNPNMEDTIGVSGEAAFARRYNLEVDKRILPKGDNHVDFIVEINNHKVSVDIKTAQKAYNLLIKAWEIEKCADILVLAQYRKGEITFIGWETKEIMKLMPKAVFSSLSIKNYYRDKDELRPMSQLDELLLPQSKSNNE